MLATVSTFVFSQRLASMTLWCIGRYGDYIVK